MAQVALVCGASGFIGRHAVEAFQAMGWDTFGGGRRSGASAVTGLLGAKYSEGDFRDRRFVEALLQRCRPDRIVFAAGPSDVQASFADPLEDFEAQTTPLFLLLDCARKQPNPPGVLLISSAAVYGNPVNLPVSETSETRPISPYGFHKLCQERLLDQFAALYGLPTCKARLFSTLGSGLRRLAVWEITRRAMHGSFQLRGHGHESRDYLPVDDIGRAIAGLAEAAPFKGEVVNVGSGCETTIAELANEIYQALGIVHAPAFDGKLLAGSPIRWCADVSTLRSFGFAQKNPLAASIAETVNWIKLNA